MIDCFFCHREKFARVASWIGYGIGTRAEDYDTNFPGGTDLNVDFVDNDFENPDVSLLIETVRDVDASYAVLPDVFPETDLSWVLSTGRLLARDGVTPIIVPKCDFDFEKIPDSWRIGYSVPSGYGSTDVPIEEFQDHEVHLLGGSPKNQFEFAERGIDAGVNIVSVDTNGFAKAANFGNLVNYPKEVYDGSGNAWLADVDGYDDWSGRVVVSLVHYYEAWRLWSESHGML